MNTTYSEVYNNFLNRITDDMYVSYTEQETYDDLCPMLKIAITRIYLPKEDVKTEILGVGSTEENPIYEFNSELSMETIDMLALLMVREWLNRQMNTVRIMETQFTGSDAKAINTKTQAATIGLAQADIDKQIAAAYHSYQYQVYDADTGKSSVTEVNLSRSGGNAFIPYKVKRRG